MRPSIRKKAVRRAPFVNLDDMKARARARLSTDVFDYIDSGACDEITRERNRRDLDDIRLRPLCLRDVSTLDLSATFLGRRFRSPVGFSPTAFHRLVHEEGETATALAAKALDVPMIVSCMSSISLGDIARNSANADLWFQTYIYKERAVTLELVQKAEQAGYKALVVTLGCPAPGKRDKNIRNGFSLPRRVTAANFEKQRRVDHNNPIHSFRGAELDPSLTWKDLDWLCSKTRLPVFVKGIMSPGDVAPALESRAAGIIVSNHGGRQLDTAESTISVLADIAAAVDRRVPLFVDGGFRRGTDLLKAYALGADGVLLGRPVLWGLACGGQKGVIAAIELLLDELRLAMQLIGCPSLDALRRDCRDIVRHDRVT